MNQQDSRFHHGKAAEFLAKPYGERQLIVVTPDELAVADVNFRGTQKDKVENVESVVLNALGVVYPGAAIAAMAVEVFRAVQKARSVGHEVLTVGRSSAEGLQFPPGHPRDRVVYVGHPARPAAYQPLAAFHRFVFEDKVAEAMRLLTGLGAKTMSIEHVTGFTSAAGIEFSVEPTRSLRGRASSEAKRKQDTQNSIVFLGNFERPSGTHLPNDLLWFPHEPLWQAIAEMRVRAHLASFSLVVRYEDDYGVHAGLKASMQRAGLDIGGSFADHEATVWRIEGEFWPSGDDPSLT